MSNFLKSQPIFDGKLKKLSIFRLCRFFAFGYQGRKSHRAWRLAHSVNCIIRFAPCALRFANSPLQKLLIIALYFLHCWHILNRLKNPHYIIGPGNHAAVMLK
jgi:hypothetical protein